MRVRRAVADDAPAIASVYVASWRHAFAGLVPQDYLDAMDPAGWTAVWGDALGGTDWPRCGLFVLVDDPPGPGPGGPEVVRGFLYLSPTRDADADPAAVAEIQRVYLAPEAMGGGGGVLLMEAALEELRLAGYRRVGLWVLGTNARARRFYERLGWRADGATKVNDWGSFARTDVRYLLELEAGSGPR